MMVLRYSFLVGAGVLLAACASSGDEELQTWMLEQRNAAHPKVVPLEEPKRFTPQPYTQRGAIDPFDPQKLTSSATISNAVRLLPFLSS